MHEKLEQVKPSSSRRAARATSRSIAPAAPSTSSPTSIATRPRATASAVRDVEDVLESAYGGRLATSIWEGERKVGVRVKLPVAAEGDPASVGHLEIPLEHARVPLSSLANIHVDRGRTQINREQGGRFLALKCNIEGRDMGSFVDEAQARVKRDGEAARGLPPDVGRRVREPAARHEAPVGHRADLDPGDLRPAVPDVPGGAAGARRLCMDVPFATVGGVFALYLTHTVLSVSAAVGFITLFGVAVMDGVLLITYVRQARASAAPTARTRSCRRCRSGCGRC